MRRVPTQAMRMPKAWPMLAFALNDQLGWGAKWKGALIGVACIVWLLRLMLE